MKIKLSFLQKTICAILMLTLVLAAVAMTVSYRTYSTSMDEHYKTMSSNVAQTTASVLDTDQIQRYTDSVVALYLENPLPDFADAAEEKTYLGQYDHLKDEGYEQLFHTLESIKISSDVLSLYIIYVDEATRSCVYIVDADNTENACPAGTWDIIYEENYGLFDNPAQGFPPYITNTEEYGWLCSTGAPVFAADGRVVAYVMVDISMDRVMQNRQDYLVRLFLILSGVTAVLILLLIRIVNRAVVKPINQLAAAAVSYVTDRNTAGRANDRSLLEQLEIHTGDEVENLSNAMKQMERDITGYIQNLTAVTAEKERIGAELDVATKIQASMLPRIFPPFPERAEFDLYATMQPAKEVGGDFYDFFLVDANTLVVVMADVSGKGVPAALFMVIAKTLIKNNTQAGKSPKEVFETVNNILCENNEADMFVTAFLGYLDIPTGKFTYVNAGHNPPLLCANGRYGWLKSKVNFVLAGMEDTRYDQYEIALIPGDGIFLYTDGVTEAVNPREELYGESQLLDTVNGFLELSPREFIVRTKKEIEAFASGTEQADDITMLTLKYKGEGHD
jgi:sigma-B regulation protein RsbU (phosphoserine phosphatase)